MTTTATQLKTAEEFYDWVHRPENAGKHFELERGRVVEVSRPGEAHGYVAGNIIRILGNYTFQKRRGYVCANDTGVLWESDPDTVRGPDVIYYPHKRKTRDLNPKYSDEAPKFLVEVLSPNDRMSKVNERLSQFLAWGVLLIWLADPEDFTITVYRSNSAPKVYKADQELTGEDVLPDFSCRVADLFMAPGEDDPAEPENAAE